MRRFGAQRLEIMTTLKYTDSLTYFVQSPEHKNHQNRGNLDNWQSSERYRVSVRQAGRYHRETVVCLFIKKTISPNLQLLG